MDGEKLEVFIHFLKRGIVRETLQQIDGMNFRKSQFEPYNSLININDLICILHACYHHLSGVLIFCFGQLGVAKDFHHQAANEDDE